MLSKKQAAQEAAAKKLIEIYGQMSAANKARLEKCLARS